MMNSRNAVVWGVLAVCGPALAGGVSDRVAADFGDYGERAVVHYAVPPMSEIPRLPGTYPVDGRAGGTVKIRVARNEFEPGSFEVWATRDLGKVKVEVGELKNAEGKAFPKEDLDIRLVKCWYQNRNAWYSYFGDTGFTLVPELLVHDEDLIRCDDARKANYAREIGIDGKVTERWINPPRQMDKLVSPEVPWRSRSAFQPMRPGFCDAKTLQPVALPKASFRQFFLTAHVTKDTPAGIYRGAIQLKNSNNSKTQTLGSIPVEVEVLDFELPAPKSFREPQTDFLVSFYSYISFNLIAEWNGGDWALARKQLKAVLRNQAEHNQSMHMLRGNPDPETFFTAETMIAAGMRPDVFQGGLHPQGRAKGETYEDHAKRMAMAFDARFGHHNLYMMYGDEPGAAWLEKARPVYRAYQQAGLKFCIAGSDNVFNKAGYLYDWHNVAKDAVDGSSTHLWNDLGMNHVAWYANQHVGAENPAFNRRQNGMGAYLAGYTALCNYAHHFGPYNDDSTGYKPMVFAYGTGDGVLDTLQWEGFREGLDDIRYATLLTQLARKAQKSDDVDVRYLGGKALQYLAAFDRTAGDLDTCRAEMTRFIVDLLKVVKADPVVPFARLAAKPAAEDAAFAAELKPAMEKFDRAKNAVEKTVAFAPVVAVYRKYFRFADMLAFAERNGDWLCAAEAADALFDAEKADALRLKALRAGKLPLVNRSPLLGRLLRRFPELATDKAYVAAWTSGASTNRTVRGLWNELTQRNRWMADGNFQVYKWVYDQAAALADKVGETEIPYKTVRYAIEASAATGDAAGIAEAAARGLRNAKLEPGERYTLALAERLLKPGATAKDVLVRPADVTEKEQVDAICAVGAYANLMNDEALVRGLDAYRKALYRPTPKKRYRVVHSYIPVGDAYGWSRLAVRPEEAVYDRSYGGSLEFLQTDVTSGNRVTGKSGEKLAATRMQIVTDDWGIHFRFVNPDEKAREVAAGLAKGGSYEAYLAPGRDKPYECLMMNIGEDRMSVFHSQYPTFGHRQLSASEFGSYRVETAYGEKEIVFCLSIPWETYATDLPTSESVWEFENLAWNRAGNCAWNGTESIHGRSTWGELVFDMPQVARARILRRLEYAAYRAFLVEVNGAHGYEGCIVHWKDTAVGDPAFYEAVVKPYADSLVEKGKMLTADVPDETALALERDGTLAAWRDIRFEIARRRTAWLTTGENGK